jgi:hypothetical protein
MTAAILEQANNDLRTAVQRRLEASCCDGQRMKGPSAAEVIERFNGCGTVVLPAGMEMKRTVGPAGSAEWLDALERLRALHHEKTAQYGGADDAFENVTASAKCGVEPWRRALCDLSDCVVRMQKYASGQPVDPTNALLDAANWALICLIKMEEANGRPE